MAESRIASTLDDMEHASSWARLYGALPRVYGVAFAVLLVSGIYLARGVGFDFPWVRLGLGLMVLMGIFGGPAIRLRVRAIRNAAGKAERSGSTRCTAKRRIHGSGRR